MIYLWSNVLEIVEEIWVEIKKKFFVKRKSLWTEFLPNVRRLKFYWRPPPPLATPLFKLNALVHKCYK